MKCTILLDSSNTSLTVALAYKETLLESISYEAWQCQSEHMIPELNKLMVKYAVTYKDVDKVIVAIGPGSYTGVRIALTIAKTIYVASKCKIYPVSSLRIQKCGQKPSICLINARSERSYFGVYEDDKVIVEDRVASNDEVMKYINEHPHYVVCGNTSYLGIEGYQSDYASEMFSLLKFLKPCEEAYSLKPKYLKD